MVAAPIIGKIFQCSSLDERVAARSSHCADCSSQLTIMQLAYRSSQLAYGWGPGRSVPPGRLGGSGVYQCPAERERVAGSNLAYETHGTVYAAKLDTCRKSVRHLPNIILDKCRKYPLANLYKSVILYNCRILYTNCTQTVHRLFTRICTKLFTNCLQKRLDKFTNFVRPGT